MLSLLPQLVFLLLAPVRLVTQREPGVLMKTGAYSEHSWKRRDIIRNECDLEEFSLICT